MRLLVIYFKNVSLSSLPFNICLITRQSYLLAYLSPIAGQPQGSEPRAAASAAWVVRVTKGLRVKMRIVVLESIHHPVVTGTALKGDLSSQSRRTSRNSRESLAKILLPTEVTTFRDTGPINVREGSSQRA